MDLNAGEIADRGSAGFARVKNATFKAHNSQHHPSNLRNISTLLNPPKPSEFAITVLTGTSLA